MEGGDKSCPSCPQVLAQSYPETPGLAVRDYWKVDERSIVFVADPTFQNILNFNVGGAVDLDVPQSFWSRLSGKYGMSSLLSFSQSQFERTFDLPRCIGHTHVPRILSSGNKFYWQEKGEAKSITDAVSAINSCLRRD